MSESRCKGCDKPIIWAVMLTNGEKKNIPLDPKPPVYRVVATQDGNPVVGRDPDAMVSHFATCPNANDFSGSKKPVGGAA